MSEIFEALRKAQRQADRRQPQQPPSTDAPVSRTAESGNGMSEPIRPISKEIRRPVEEKPKARTSGSRRWMPKWLRHTSRNGDGRSPGLPLLISPRNNSAVSEQFRVLRTRIETVGRGSFMVTSALDREGKTLCASNLAAALSMSIGGGVILVDADLHNPSIAPNFGIEDSPGLVNYLRGEVPWTDCLRQTPVDRLRLLPAGRGSYMSTELLASERMFNMINEMKDQYPDHYILLDAPPLLLTADPLVLARHVDHVLLVVRADVTPRGAVSKAIETLGPDRFLGVVFNGATENVSQYYYYGRYPYSGRSTT
jgi:protein-tyrosine kinase